MSKSKYRKKLQREVNKLVRDVNKNIENDSLWLGRFYAHQVKTDYNRFEDGSGGTLYVGIELVDKKTGIKKIIYTSYSGGLSGLFTCVLFEELNHFITRDCDVWRKEDPFHSIVDYRGRR